MLRILLSQKRRILKATARFFGKDKTSLADNLEIASSNLFVKPPLHQAPSYDHSQERQELMFDSYHLMDFFFEKQNTERRLSLFRQIKTKFNLSKRESEKLRLLVECLQEAVEKGAAKNCELSDLHEALEWILSSDRLDSKNRNLNSGVIILASSILDFIYLLIHFEEKKPGDLGINQTWNQGNLNNTNPHAFEQEIASNPRPKGVRGLLRPSKKEHPPVPVGKQRSIGLIFTAHPCGLNKNEKLFRTILEQIELSQDRDCSPEAKLSARETIQETLRALLTRDFFKLKPKVLEETVNLQNSVLEMSKALMEQSKEFNIRVSLDTWTGVEADRNATTPELQLQTILLNKLRGFEVYTHHLTQIRHEAGYHLHALEGGELKALQQILGICTGGLAQLESFERNIAVGLKVVEQLARLVVMGSVKGFFKEQGVVDLKGLGQAVDVEMTMASVLDLEAFAGFRNKYVDDSVQQMFSEESLYEFLEHTSVIFAEEEVGHSHQIQIPIQRLQGDFSTMLNVLYIQEICLVFIIILSHSL